MFWVKVKIEDVTSEDLILEDNQKVIAVLVDTFVALFCGSVLTTVNPLATEKLAVEVVQLKPSVAVTLITALLLFVKVLVLILRELP